MKSRWRLSAAVFFHIQWDIEKWSAAWKAHEDLVSCSLSEGKSALLKRLSRLVQKIYLLNPLLILRLRLLKLLPRLFLLANGYLDGKKLPPLVEAKSLESFGLCSDSFVCPLFSRLSIQGQNAINFDPRLNLEVVQALIRLDGLFLRSLERRFGIVVDFLSSFNTGLNFVDPSCEALERGTFAMIIMYGRDEWHDRLLWHVEAAFSHAIYVEAQHRLILAVDYFRFRSCSFSSLLFSSWGLCFLEKRKQIRSAAIFLWEVTFVIRHFRDNSRDLWLFGGWRAATFVVSELCGLLIVAELHPTISLFSWFARIMDGLHREELNV